MLQLKEIDWLNGYKIKTYIYAVTRDPLQLQELIQTESEGMEQGTPCKQKTKDSQSSNTHITQNKL